jgi:hypothetical protein
MERVDADLVPFAQNNPSGYRFAFGTDTATDDINANYNDNIKRGWGTTPNEFPEIEDFNGFAYTTGYLLSYLYQMGISEWNNKQKYRQYSRVIGSNGKIYKAKTGTDLAPNVNQNPTADTVNWELDNQFEINSLTAKTTPADADNLAISDSASSHVLKKTTWANIKTAILSSFGVMINTATAKTTPADNDIFIIADSASSNATKKTTWANIKTAMSGLYVGLTGNQTIAGVKTFSSQPVSTATQGTSTNDVVKYGTINTANSAPIKTALNASGTAPIYACRAWVNFNGTGTVAIRASGNVSSITDNGVGDYTVNFTTVMSDDNYSANSNATDDLSNVVASTCINLSRSISGARFKTSAGTASFQPVDRNVLSILIFR